ncbi:MAG: hypothetical protein COS88_01020 [Chloroflexi bacterium CG07_land_8_20_14_0_80_51_10]|nr:MAG: hypothetical protein COS88_01020 [Chloroflexi bacterium CG07_land_8_20_14_0_80_51_10]
MDYLPEEIRYVEFCVNHFSCEIGRKKCPIYASCYENGDCQGLCDAILDKMKNGELLSEEDRKIITFFQNSKQLEEDDCFVKGTDKPCPNRELCEEKERKEEELICDELIQRLDPSTQKIAEKVIQRVIFKNCPNEWGLGEKVALSGYEKSIPDINGRIDIQLKGDNTATTYIVELKLKATREHVGQLASYVGWCKNHPIPGQTKAVKGILLAENFDNGALAALEACPDLVAKICKLRVDIENIQQM